MSSLEKSAEQSGPAAASSVRETLSSLGVDSERGLSAADAKSRLARFGANEIPEKRDHPLILFARKFWGLSGWMLELIVVLSFILHKRATCGWRLLARLKNSAGTRP